GVHGWAGQGFPGDEEAFEADLQRAPEASSETDPNAVAAVIVDYRGRIRLSPGPGLRDRRTERSRPVRTAEAGGSARVSGVIAAVTVRAAQREKELGAEQTLDT